MFPGKIAETAPDRPAIIMSGSGETLTFGQLDAGANRLSHVLAGLGLKPVSYTHLTLPTICSV